MRRLQIGASGVLGVILLIGLANMIVVRAQQTDQTAVSEAEPTTAPTPSEVAADPLAEAGVVPDVPGTTEKPRAIAPGTGAAPAGSPAPAGSGAR